MSSVICPRRGHRVLNSNTAQKLQCRPREHKMRPSTKPPCRQPLIIPPHCAFDFRILCSLETARCSKSVLLLTAKMLRLNWKKKKKSVYLARWRCEGIVEKHQLKCITPRMAEAGRYGCGLCGAQIVGWLESGLSWSRVNTPIFTKLIWANRELGTWTFPL